MPFILFMLLVYGTIMLLIFPGIIFLFYIVELYCPFIAVVFFFAKGK
jgi:hypothetical protein